MGYDAEVKAMIGIQLPRYFRKTRTTKYNVDTGIPYLLEQEVAVYVFGDKEYGYGDIWNVDFGGLYIESDGESGSAYVGMPVSTATSLETIQRAWKEVKETLVQLGCLEVVKLHVFLYESY